MITLPIIHPVLPSFEEFFTLLRPSWKSGMIPNGSFVKELEKATCHLRQAAHAVADRRRSPRILFASCARPPGSLSARSILRP